MRRPRSPALLALALAFFTLGAGCITPSIPIPPPSPERMVFEVDMDLGTATFAYPADGNYSDAIVYIFNRTLGEGVITTAASNGSVAPTTFPAELNDEVSITFEADDQIASTCVVLRAQGPSATCN